MSLSDYLLAELREIAERPTLAEFRERLHTRRPVAAVLDTAGLVREERAARFAWVWLLSWASFRWYEMPFLRLKNRWGGGGENRKAVPAGEARTA